MRISCTRVCQHTPKNRRTLHLHAGQSDRGERATIQEQLPIHLQSSSLSACRDTEKASSNGQLVISHHEFSQLVLHEHIGTKHSRRTVTATTMASFPILHHQIGTRFSYLLTKGNACDTNSKRECAKPLRRPRLRSVNSRSINTIPPRV